MKRIFIFIVAALLSLSLTACAGNGTSADTTEQTPVDTSDVTVETESSANETEEQTTEQITNNDTEETTSNEPETEDETENEADKKYPEDWDEDDPRNPYNNLIPVGTSYDGKTTSYDGRYSFYDFVCKTQDGQMFFSVQEAIYYLETIGGGVVNMIDDTNICLNLVIPNDGNSYQVSYDYHNCDFTFNYGVIFDDNIPITPESPYGYRYYNQLEQIDTNAGIPVVIPECFVWVVADSEEWKLTAGCYRVNFEGSEDPDYPFIFLYEPYSDLTTWLGLPNGEALPE